MTELPATIDPEVQLTEKQARALTDRITKQVNGVWELIQKAYIQRAWTALGYGTWDDYVDAEFRAVGLSLPREDRDEVVASLRAGGMSVRAIAAATDTSVGTIHASVDRIDDGEDEGATVIGLDDRQHPRKKTATKTNGERQPKAKPAALDMIAVARPETAPEGTFSHGAILGYGSPDFGAAVTEDGMVQWYSEGSYDDIEPAKARILAGCLLAAAEVAESG